MLFAALIAVLPLRGQEQNAWPISVRQFAPDGTLKQGEYLGPLFFEQNRGDGRAEGFRPIYVQNRTGDKERRALFYPFFIWDSEPGYHSFSFFQLVNHRREDETGAGSVRNFDLWPFYFSKETGDPATTYHALLPVAGTIKERFGKDRLTWFAFPLYFHTEKAGMTITSAPWPFIRIIDGAGHHGFEFWPFFGSREHPGDYSKQFLLWPLVYREVTHLDEPQPDVKVGALPFYTRDTGPGYISETYAWPFFGYTHRTAPDHYDERRYLWPFLVQGRGDHSYINRWAPFYTHSDIKGYDKHWLLWPLFRHAAWQEAGVAQDQRQVLWFVYWSLTQRSLTNPAAAPAYKTHLWPLFSAWDNGAGRRQVQLLSPFEVLFPENETVRQVYTPLFALYRYDRQGAEESSHALLWNAITYRRAPGTSRFHLGPLLSVDRTPEGRRIALGLGLISLRRDAGHGWRLFLFDFNPKADNKSAGTQSP